MTDVQLKKSQTELTYTAVEVCYRAHSIDGQWSLLQKGKNALKKCWKNNGWEKFMITALGIKLSFLCDGLILEKIMKTCYGDDNNKDCRNGDRFTFTTSVIAVQFVCAYLCMKALDVVKPEKKDSTHYASYVFAAVINSIAMVCSNIALIWVSYPFQVIIKSAKPISIMVTGLIFCKRYPIQRYFFVVLIVLGVVVFKLYESKEGKTHAINKQEADKDYYNQIYGISLLSFSVAMDGLLGVMQDRIRDAHSPTPGQMMLAMTGWISFLTTCYVFATGEIVDVTAFVRRYPQLVWYLSVYALVGFLGQLFVFSMITSFGSLACSVTTTVRKFLSVVLSIIFFGHPFNPIQWLGAILVFSGLLADIFSGTKFEQNKPDADIAQSTVEPLNMNKKSDKITSENDIKKGNMNIV